MKPMRRGQERRGLQPFAEAGGSPWGALSRLRREMDRLFDERLGLAGRSTSFFGEELPKVDVYETHDKITVQAELPGMKKEDIDVSLQGNMLSVSGERKEEREGKEGETYRSERYFGRFQRSIMLPQPVDANKIEARYKDGILTLTCPKTEEAKGKRIEVKTK